MKRITLLAILVVLGCGCALSAQPSQAVIGERGNWVKQRGWLKEAQLANEQVQKDAHSVKKSRTQFFTEFERIDKKINEFYGTQGFARGKMTSIVTDLKADMHKDKERRLEAARKRSEADDAPINFYDVQREAIEQDVARLEREFEQFNLDMKSIADLDASLSERLKAVDKQIKDSSDVAVESAKKVDEMWWIIDDRKAADAFYVVQGFADKVSSIKKYLDEVLFTDFKKVAQTIEKQIEQVNKQVTAIEQRGLVVSHRATRVLKKEVPDVLAVVAEEVAEESRAPRRRTTPVIAQSWGEYIMSLPQVILSSIGALIQAPITFLQSFGSSPVTVKHKRRRVDYENKESGTTEQEASEKE